MMKKLLVLMAMVLNLSLALAAVDVSFHGTSNDGPVNRFSMFAYDCLDASCTQPGQFSGWFTDESSTGNGTITIRFPDSLATPFGYAMFAVDEFEEFRPMELGPAIVHSNGNSFVFESDMDIPFSKIANCRSLVHDMTVLNEAKPNIPLVVAMNAALDAETVSAFRKLNNGIGFVPSEVRDWYSAETQVVLEIVHDDTGAVVERQQVVLNLFADTSQRVEFSYVPRNEGRYSARIRSEVTDPVCEVVTPQSSVKQFVVLDEEPNDECYTLLNNLALSTAFPTTGNSVGATFNKISNYANGFGILEPVATLLQIVVTGPLGEVIYQDQFVANANANTLDPVQFAFSWVAQTSGLHRVTVAGIGEDFKCDLRPNSWEVISTDVFVDTPQGPGDDPGDEPDPEDFAFDAVFRVLDSRTLEPVDNAKVRIVENGFQDETSTDGVATIDDLVNGVYTFKVTHDEYDSFTGVFVIDSQDQEVLVVLEFNPDDSADTRRTHVQVSSVRIPSAESVRPGEVLELSVNLDNDGDFRLENARATVTIIELGVHDTVGPFDVRVGDAFTKRLFVQIPSDAAAGVYNARITIGTGKHTRVLYRQIRVMEGN